jgi:hypothetical protein
MPYVHRPHFSRREAGALGLMLAILAVTVLLAAALVATVLLPVATMPPPGVPLSPAF